jgi:hypothetical protein
MTSGDQVHYRCFAGQVCDAIVTAIRDEYFLDLDVIVPGCSDRVHLTAVRYNSEPAPWARVWPKDPA